jgi:hypothetical protein
MIHYNHFTVICTRHSYRSPGGISVFPSWLDVLKTTALAGLLQKPCDKSTLLRVRSTLLCANIVARYKTTQKRFHVLHDLQTKNEPEDLLLLQVSFLFHPSILEILTIMVSGNVKRKTGSPNISLLVASN